MSRDLGAVLMLSMMVPAAASAQSIPIANHSFEQMPAGAGCFDAFGIPPGWIEYDPNDLFPGGGNFFGVLNPGPTTYFLPGQVPDGDNVALLFFQGSIGLGELGLRQFLGVNLEGPRTYRLSVGVGNIASGASPVPPCSNGDFFDLDAFPGYAVELLAGGALLDEDDDSLDIPEGEFRTSIIEVTIEADDPRIGGELEIRLISLNEDDPSDPDDPGIEVDFDNVVLEAFPPCSSGDVAGPYGEITSVDVTTFVDLFNALDPAADVDGTPGVDFLDMVTQLNAVAAGCP
jgi:hypothetical protein